MPLRGGGRARRHNLVCLRRYPQKETGEADLSQVEAVARIIARNLNGYKLFVEKSTMPAITAQWIKKTVARFAKLLMRQAGRPPSST